MDKNLSPREHEVVQYMCKGLTNDEIAKEINIKTSTVKAHLKSVYKKLNVKNRVEAILYIINTYKK